MNVILNIVLVVMLVMIAYQDMKLRLIHFMLPIMLFLVAIYSNWKLITYAEMGKSLLFLALNFSIMVCYFSIKNKKWVNPFKELIGVGDVLFLVSAVPLFSFRNYLLFFVSGMTFSLLLFLIFKSTYRKEKTVPLAGYLSIFILGLMGLDKLVTQNIFYGFII